MSGISILQFLPLLLLWVIFRVGRYALAPMLADSRAASRHAPRPLARATASRSAAAAGGLPGWTGALLAGGTAALIYWLLAASGNLYSWVPVNFSMSYDFYYRYTPGLDAGLAVAAAFWLYAGGRTGLRRALTALVAVAAALFAYDVVFNFIGSLNFDNEADFYGGGELGLYLWVIYYLFYGWVLVAVLGFFSPHFRKPAPWIVVAAAAVVSPLLSAVGEPGFVERIFGPFDLNYVAAQILIATAAGWWMRPVPR